MNILGKSIQEHNHAPNYDAEFNPGYLQIAWKAFDNTHNQAWKQEPGATMPDVIANNVEVIPVNNYQVLSDTPPVSINAAPAAKAAPYEQSLEPLTDSPETRARQLVERVQGESQTLNIEGYAGAKL